MLSALIDYEVAESQTQSLVGSFAGRLQSKQKDPRRRKKQVGEESSPTSSHLNITIMQLHFNPNLPVSALNL